MSLTGQAIIRAIVAGERDPKALARRRHSRVKASEQDIAKALTGNWRDAHLFVLRQALAMYDDIGRHLRECEAQLQELLSQLGQTEVDLDKLSRAGGKLLSSKRCWRASSFFARRRLLLSACLRSDVTISGGPMR